MNMLKRCEVSPASNGGCGLKLDDLGAHIERHMVSPASNGGCGLKHACISNDRNAQGFHPPVMAGVD